MKKPLSLFALFLLAVPTIVQATELNPDPNFNSPALWMLGTGWSISGAALHGVGATAMKMTEMSGITGIKPGHRYKVVYTVANYTGGASRPFVGLTMSTPYSAPTIPCCISDVADNFTYANGIASSITPADSADPVGAFRMECAQVLVAPNDPEVLPGQPNASHFHSFFGNTGANGNSTYNSLRTTGGTSCGNSNSQTSPLNRSAYWFPSMMDRHGHVIRNDYVQLYYKSVPAGNPACGAPDSTHVGYCTALPNGIRFLHGYNFANGRGGPTDSTYPSAANPDSANIFWQCWAGFKTAVFASGTVEPNAPASTSGLQYTSIEAVRAAGCPIGDRLVAIMISPDCWDGTDLDTPDHRAHMSRATGAPVNVQIGAGPSTGVVAACPADHPYSIPDIQLQLHWTVDAAFEAGEWHLASDEMVHGAVAGSTLHQDYFEAWSPTAKNTWFTDCINAHKSCAGGGLGDGTMIAGGDNTIDGGNASASPPLRYIPTDLQGLGRQNTGNGTFTEEITAPKDAAQAFGIMAIDDASGTALTADITYLSVTDLGAVAKGPVTVHNP